MEWFPNHLLEGAVGQATVLLPSQPFFVADRVYDREGARMLDADRIQPGLTLIATMWQDTANGSWKPGLRLIDSQGRTHHQWLVDPATSFPDSARRGGAALGETEIHGSYLFPNGDVIINLEYLGSARLDACGRMLWRVMEGNHHSVARDEDGSFWIPGVTHLRPARSSEHPMGFPGLADSVFHDLILHIDEDGNVLKKLDVLDILYANGLQRYIPRFSNETGEGLFRLRPRADVTHLNDVEPLSARMAEQYALFAAGDLLVSLRYLNVVFVVDPESKRVKWHASDPFFHQHDPDFMGNGWIGVFDNNQDGTPDGTMLGGSRIVALNPSVDSVRVLFPTAESERLYTRYRGKWQWLHNGNMLITEATAGRIAEIAPDGHTVWDWVARPYDARTIPQVTEGTRYDLTPEDVASWPCASTAERD